MPERFGYLADCINPELRIHDTPPGTVSLALIMEDTDASGGSFIHWAVFDIPVTDSIPEDSIPGKQAVNSAKRKNYTGPRPPSGTHRYVFRVYALDTFLNREEGISLASLQRSMEEHILGSAELTGLYSSKEAVAR
jgi:Raf kinase inhibitor-like YbhB/YbcL family protein